MRTIEILTPGPDAGASDHPQLARRGDVLRGSTVGLVNNSWRCMDIIAAELTDQLRDQCGVADFVEMRISAAQTLSSAQLDEISTRCGAVVVGIGN